MAQARSMAWQAIAGGANGIVFYSYFDIQRNPDVPFAVEWDRLLEVATEIKAFVPVLLSDQGAAALPAATAAAKPVSRLPWLRMRAQWVDSGEVPSLLGAASSAPPSSTREYVVFAVADGNGAGAVTFTLPPDVLAHGAIGSVATCATPFAGGMPSRAVSVSRDGASWTDTIRDMEMVAYRVVLSGAQPNHL